MGKRTYNFANVSAAVTDSDSYALDISTTILRGFGISEAIPLPGGGHVQKLIQSGKRLDLVLCEAVLVDMAGNELVSWLRRHDDPLIRCIPIIILTGHTRASDVLGLRDSGANSIIKKPIAAGQLFDRITWAATSGRKFLDTDSYVGPDRRFRNSGPPDGIGRRSTDLSAIIGEANAPNLSQEEIDSFITPTRMRIE